MQNGPGLTTRTLGKGKYPLGLAKSREARADRLGLRGSG
jgi:hypothetical protein